MILNTGNRSDIPAFFSDWFFNRIQEGFVCVRNPLTIKRLNPMFPIKTKLFVASLNYLKK